MQFFPRPRPPSPVPASTYLVDDEGDGVDEGGVGVLGGRGHVCQGGEESDAVRAVHLRQPALEALLVAWV